MANRRDSIKKSYRYREELAKLPSTYDTITKQKLTSLRQTLWSASDRRTFYVGSGGTLPTAHLASDIHEHLLGGSARAMTPLELASQPALYGAAVIFSSSGKHPDVASALSTSNRAGHDPIVLVTHRTPSALPSRVVSQQPIIVTLPSLPIRDGFLATNSVLAMSAAVVQCYSTLSGCLPKRLPLLANPPHDIPAGRVLVIYSPKNLPAAIDLETRLHELGLASVQLADYRNLAHGRHVGLSRHLKETTIVALITKTDTSLAEATLKNIPSSAHIVRLATPLEWPFSVLDLMVGSMFLVAQLADASEVEPAKPGVPAFGRRLYHLPLTELVHSSTTNPIARKTAALGGPVSSETIEAYKDSLDTWLQEVRARHFNGIVLDYDGTCCTTAGRFELPPDPIRTELLRILEEGMAVSFATGRGPSLHVDLRKWVPETFWPHIRLGLYNGGLRLLLSDDIPPRLRMCQGELADFVKRATKCHLAPLIKVEARLYQVTVTFNNEAKAPLGGKALAAAMTEQIAKHPTLALKVASSAHSVDVLPIGTTKAAVLQDVQRDTEGDVLAIGDKGKVGGNDFELLAATPTSLSVDECSADPTRCWNLDTKGLRGPDMLAKYLKALVRRKVGLRFSWRLP